jgi:hypothetical protein
MHSIAYSTILERDFLFYSTHSIYCTRILISDLASYKITYLSLKAFQCGPLMTFFSIHLDIYIHMLHIYLHTYMYKPLYKHIYIYM